MIRILTLLFVVLALSFYAAAQAGKTPAQPPSTTTKKGAQTKALSVAELHDIARGVSVLLAERTLEAPSGTKHLGSGVWLAEGIVATCWHVVKDVKGPIKISLGTGGVVTTTPGDNVFEMFMDYAATIVASDPDADVAILKTEQNPFKSTATLIKTPTQEIKPKLSVARVNEEIPVAGTPTVLSGYPLAGWDLVSQTGNVAGTAVPDRNATGIKGVRILVSVVSNYGNSGGPVLNDHGEVIGLQEGNLTTVIIDPQTRTPLLGILPKTDAAGNPLKDDKGNIQIVGLVTLTQNSGISYVIPTRLLTPLLKQAEEKK